MLSFLLCITMVRSDMQMAIDALRERNLKEAVVFLKEDVEKGNENALLMRGDIFKSLNLYELALEDYNKLCSFNRGPKKESNDSCDKVTNSVYFMYLQMGNVDLASKFSENDSVLKEIKESLQKMSVLNDSRDVLRLCDYVLSVCPFFENVFNKRLLLLEELKEWEELRYALQKKISYNNIFSSNRGLSTDNLFDLNLFEKYESKRSTHYAIANLFLAEGDLLNTNKELSACLESDPEYRPCLSLFKTVRRFSKKISNRKIEEIEDLLKVLERKEKEEKFLFPVPLFSSFIYSSHEILCFSYKKPELILNHCMKIEQSANVLLRLSEAYLAQSDFENNVRCLEEAFNKERTTKIQNLLKEARIRLKREKNGSYYKTLGVSSTATASEIKAAYSKAVRMWHPDKNEDSKKKEASEKMKKLNDAYEVLGNVESRRKYDMGNDILDPEPSAASGFSNDFFANSSGGYSFYF